MLEEESFPYCRQTKVQMMNGVILPSMRRTCTGVPAVFVCLLVEEGLINAEDLLPSTIAAEAPWPRFGAANPIIGWASFMWFVIFVLAKCVRLFGLSRKFAIAVATEHKC